MSAKTTHKKSGFCLFSACRKKDKTRVTEQEQVRSAQVEENTYDMVDDGATDGLTSEVIEESAEVTIAPDDPQTTVEEQEVVDALNDIENHEEGDNVLDSTTYEPVITSLKYKDSLEIQGFSDVDEVHSTDITLIHKVDDVSQNQTSNIKNNIDDDSSAYSSYSDDTSECEIVDAAVIKGLSPESMGQVIISQKAKEKRRIVKRKHRSVKNVITGTDNDRIVILTGKEFKHQDLAPSDDDNDSQFFSTSQNSEHISKKSFQLAETQNTSQRVEATESVFPSLDEISFADSESERAEVEEENIPSEQGNNARQYATSRVATSTSREFVAYDNTIFPRVDSVELPPFDEGYENAIIVDEPQLVFENRPVLQTSIGAAESSTNQVLEEYLSVHTNVQQKTIPQSITVDENDTSVDFVDNTVSMETQKSFQRITTTVEQAPIKHVDSTLDEHERGTQHVLYEVGRVELAKPNLSSQLRDNDEIRTTTSTREQSWIPYQENGKAGGVPAQRVRKAQAPKAPDNRNVDDSQISPSSARTFFGNWVQTRRIFDSRTDLKPTNQQFVDDHKNSDVSKREIKKQLRYDEANMNVKPPNKDRSNRGSVAKQEYSDDGKSIFIIEKTAMLPPI